MCKLGRSLDNSSLSGVSSYHKSGYTTEKQGMYAVWMKGHILVTLRNSKMIISFTQHANVKCENAKKKI